MGWSSVLKQKKVVPATGWMDASIAVLNGRSQVQKSHIVQLTFMNNLKIGKTKGKEVHRHRGHWFLREGSRKNGGLEVTKHSKIRQQW